MLLLILIIILLLIILISLFCTRYIGTYKPASTSKSQNTINSTVELKIDGNEVTELTLGEGLEFVKTGDKKGQLNIVSLPVIVNPGIKLRSSINTTNFNQSVAQTVLWDILDYNDDVNLFDVSNDTIKIMEMGRFMIYFNLLLESENPAFATRDRMGAFYTVNNGNIHPNYTQAGYIRNDAGADSDHLTSISLYDEIDLNVDDLISIKCEGLLLAGGANDAVFLTGVASTFIIRKI